MNEKRFRQAPCNPQGSPWIDNRTGSHRKANALHERNHGGEDHPIPYRTRQLSSPSPKVLRWSPWEDRPFCSCRAFLHLEAPSRGFSFLHRNAQGPWGPTARRAERPWVRACAAPGQARPRSGACDAPPGHATDPCRVPASFRCRLAGRASAAPGGGLRSPRGCLHRSVCMALPPGGRLPGALALGTEAGLLQDRTLGLACLLSRAALLGSASSLGILFFVILTWY